MCKSKLIQIILYRLFDKSYGESGNPRTLSVLLREDNTLSYVCYGGWQNSGMGHSMSNLQLQKSLPTSIYEFKGSVKALDKTIQEVLATGVGSRHIKTYEILNNIPNVVEDFK